MRVLSTKLYFIDKNYIYKIINSKGRELELEIVKTLGYDEQIIIYVHQKKKYLTIMRRAREGRVRAGITWVGRK